MVSPRLARERAKHLAPDGCDRAQQIGNVEEVMLRATARFRDAESKDLQGIVAEKLEDLQEYDVLAWTGLVDHELGQERLLLLVSYLDGHDDAMVLPELSGERVYEFFERYQCFALATHFRRNTVTGRPQEAATGAARECRSGRKNRLFSLAR